jgi:PmbA protein
MTTARAKSEQSQRSPLEIAREVLARSRRIEADLEAYVQFGRTVTIKTFAREVESVTVAEPRGVGIRAVNEGRTGYAFTSDLRETGLSRAVAEAYNNLRAADTDPFTGLPGVSTEGYPSLPGLWLPGISTMRLDQKISLALEAEAAALAAPGVDTVEESVYSDEEARIAIAATAGIEAEAEQSYSYVYVLAHAGGDGDRQSGLGFSAAREPGALDAEQAGRDAAAKALALLGARPCRTGSYTVVFDREVTAALVSSIAQALSADAVHKGRSVFAGKMDTPVASPLLTLLDDGLALEGMATNPFDGEGVPRQSTCLIDGGMLRSYLYDSHTARREGGTARSTGNAARGSYRSLPQVGPSNLVVRAGNGTLEDMLSRVSEGIYVESAAGLHSGVNVISGEFSVGVTGRMIEGGDLGKPVREVTIAGDFVKLLSGICDMAADARWIPFYGSVYTPAIAVREVAVSGLPGREEQDS